MRSVGSVTTTTGLFPTVTFGFYTRTTAFTYLPPHAPHTPFTTYHLHVLFPLRLRFGITLLLRFTFFFTVCWFPVYACLYLRSPVPRFHHYVLVYHTHTRTRLRTPLSYHYTFFTHTVRYRLLPLVRFYTCTHTHVYTFAAFPTRVWFTVGWFPVTTHILPALPPPHAFHTVPGSPVYGLLPHFVLVLYHHRTSAPCPHTSCSLPPHVGLVDSS